MSVIGKGGRAQPVFGALTMTFAIRKKHLALTLCLLLLAAAGGANPLPFAPGEMLHYEVRWEEVPVAQVSLEVGSLGQIRGAPVHHFIFRARSYPVLDALYPVDGSIEAFADWGLTRSLGMEKDMREGWRRRVYRIEFDWERGLASYVKGEKTRRTAPLPAGTLDVLSILYYVRSLPLEEGLEMTRPLSSGKKTYQIDARVLRKETIKVGGRPWPAYLIEPDVRQTGGVFEKSSHAEFLLWISADERRIPLRVMSKVWVGAFIAELAAVPPDFGRSN